MVLSEYHIKALFHFKEERQMGARRRDNKGRILKDGESQRDDGRYMYRYQSPDGTRKTIYSWRLVETDSHPAGKKKELSLREMEVAIQKDLMDGININGASVTLNELFLKYIRTKKRLKSNVKDNYVCLYNKHVKDSLIGNRLVKDIRKIDILNLYATISDSGLSNGTIHIIHNNILSPMFQMAVDNDWIRKNPSEKCLKEYPHDPLNRREALSSEEEKIFLNFLEKDNVYSKYLPIVELVLETALRRGEILGLTWKDVDFKKGFLYIDHQLQYCSTGGKYIFRIGTPKTDLGKRAVPLSKKAVLLLKNLKEKEDFNSLRSQVSIDGYRNFIFLNGQKNNVLIPRQFGDGLVAACKKYNKEETRLADRENRGPKLLPIITPHILRHTACTRMAEAGIDIKVLQTIMGHKTVDLTMNIYNHADLERVKREFTKADNRESACLLG